MTPKSYFPLDNEYNVLALLQKGYSFIQVGNTISSKAEGSFAQELIFTEAIPQMEQQADQEYVMLSQFLKGAPQTCLQVDSRYF